MDTLSVFLIDLEHRWNWHGEYPKDRHTVQIVMKHLGLAYTPEISWSQISLLRILEALVARALAEHTEAAP